MVNRNGDLSRCSLFSLVAVPRLPDGFLIWLLVSTGSRTRGYSPSASRLSDASFLQHNYLLYSTRYWNNRLEDGYLNSRGLLSPRKNLTTHNSPLIAQCQTFLLLSIGCALLSKWTKTGQNSSKTNLKSHSKLPYCEILIFQLRKNNFPVEK